MSFVPVSPNCHFSYRNLPYGVFSTQENKRPRIGVAIGEQILDLYAVRDYFDGPILKDNRNVFEKVTLNNFMALGRSAWKEARATIQKLLSESNPTLRDDAELRAKVLVPRKSAQMHLPAQIGDYTDFLSCANHLENCIKAFDGNVPMPPNFYAMPLAYHGRSSSIFITGTDVYRPMGQIKPKADENSVFTPTKGMDFELETAIFIGPGNEPGEPITMEEADEHIFGMVLMNDWSARDIQNWEMVPLGPFLSKSTATSVSPWIVTMEALEPFKTTPKKQDAATLPHLKRKNDYLLDIHLEVRLKTAEMKEAKKISETNSKELYWTLSQMVAHHSSNGCNLRPGDMLATGTVSGTEPNSLGCILELSKGGKDPIDLGSGIKRAFLEDGDQVTLSGYCQGNGFRVGFGECSGTLLPTKSC